MEDRSKLEWLLTYELKLASRYRHFVSLVMMTPTDETEVDMECMLETSLRDCDEYFMLGNTGVVLMPHTGKKEAQKAIDRFKLLCNDTIDLRYSIAWYPGQISASDMIETATQRLGVAREQGHGAVVYKGKPELNKMTSAVRRFFGDEQGLETVEYAVMTSMIVATIATALGA